MRGVEVTDEEEAHLRGGRLFAAIAQRELRHVDTVGDHVDAARVHPRSEGGAVLVAQHDQPFEPG